MLPYTVRVALKTDSNAPGNACRHLSEERLVQMNEEKPNSNYQDPPLCEAHYFCFTSPRFLNVKGQVKCIRCKVLPIQFDINVHCQPRSPRFSPSLCSGGQEGENPGNEFTLVRVTVIKETIFECQRTIIGVHKFMLQLLFPYFLIEYYPLSLPIFLIFLTHILDQSLADVNDKGKLSLSISPS